MDCKAMMTAAANAPAEHEATHERAAIALASAAPSSVTASINDLIAKARALQIPWAKIAMAIMTAAMGGFTPEAIAAALALLFGATPTPAAP